MDYEAKAVSLEILIKLYISNKPIHYSVFLEESLGSKKDWLSCAKRLTKEGLVKNTVLFRTKKETPLFFELSGSGKKLIEDIITRFPVKK